MRHRGPAFCDPRRAEIGRRRGSAVARNGLGATRLHDGRGRVSRESRESGSGVCGMNRPSRSAHDDDAASRRAARFVAAVAYDGSEFSGWQCQPNGRGVQDVIEARLSRLLGAPAVIAGAGRTDAGVHARAQVFHFDVHATGESAACRGAPSPLALARRAAADGTGTELGIAAELERCLCGLPENSGVPPSVRVLAVRPAPPRFHARDSCVGKRYVYSVREGVPSPFEARYCWALGLRRGASGRVGGGAAP